MSKRSHRSRASRTVSVFIPELKCKVVVRGLTDGETRGPAAVPTTLDGVYATGREAAGRFIISPNLTGAQLQSLSEATVKRVCEVAFRLNPRTAHLVPRGRGFA